MQLKKIFENMEKMPSTLKGFNETPKLSPEQKRKLMEMVRQYNELGQKLKMENSLIETAQAIAEISELAETYACNEAQDWFATEVVKKDFKRARGVSESFQKLSRECHGKVQQLNALFEDLGSILSRYYAIDDPQPTIDSTQKVGGSNPQQKLPATGAPSATPMQEVNHNESNLQSQRELPEGGPESYTPPTPENPSPELKVAGPGEMNLQGQREEPEGGPQSFKFPTMKEIAGM